MPETNSVEFLPSRTLIADSHGLAREAIAFILSSIVGLEIIGEAGDCNGALSIIEANRPQLLILDLHLPGGDPIEIVRTFSSRQPPTACIVVATYATDADIFRAIQAGAKGYFLKASSRGMILEAVREVLRGNTFPSNLSSYLPGDAP